MDRVTPEQMFRAALDEPPPPEASEDHDDWSGNEQEPSQILQVGVFVLAILGVLAVELIVWTVAFILANVFFPGVGRTPADITTNMLWSSVAVGTVYGCLRQRVGWRWKWWL